MRTSFQFRVYIVCAFAIAPFVQPAPLLDNEKPNADITAPDGDIVINTETYQLKCTQSKCSVVFK